MKAQRFLELAGISSDSPLAKRLMEAEEKKEEEKKEEEKPSEPKAEDEEKKEEAAPVTTDALATVTPAAALPAAPAVTTTTDVTPAVGTAPAAAPSSTYDAVSVAKLFFAMRDQVHLYHLQTESFAEHKALNDFYDGLLDLADAFLEAFIGVKGRAQGDVSFQLKAYSAENVRNDLNTFMAELKKLQESVKDNTDLVNLVDEILNLSNKTLYLLTLK